MENIYCKIIFGLILIFLIQINLFLWADPIHQEANPQLDKIRGKYFCFI